MENRKKSDILYWIEKSLENEQFMQQEISIVGTNEKIGDYMGDIFFATVNGLCKNGDNKIISLVIKIGKQEKSLRKQLPMLSECFRREILVYDRVKTTFNKFQEEKNITDYFNPFPKCYKTFVTEYLEVLVLEDLTKQGYVLQERSMPMNSQHIEFILSNYAKLHALSFALQDQGLEEYRELTSNYHRHNIQIIGQLRELFQLAESKVIHDLKVESREDLVNKFKEIVGIGIVRRLLDILEDDVMHSVITHGGSFNNNFMFLYEKNDFETPMKMVMLDWQVSIQHSPVIDLSGLLYSLGGDHMKKLPELLDYYHSTLARFLKALGTEVTKVYPKTALLEDWRKYSFYGFIYMITFFETMWIEKRNTSGDIDRAQDTIKVEKEYRNTLINAIDQYCNHII